MFTGLIQQVGKLRRVERVANGFTLSIAHAPWDEPLARGESVAVQGACLTVARIGADVFDADLLDETMQRTSLGALAADAAVNLERALRMGERLGGHMVAGHVDEVGRVVAIEPRGRDRRVRVSFSTTAARQTVLKGSITLDGISLTVTGLGEDWFSVDIIPHTWQATSLAERKVGDQVNIETDLFGKYVERLLGRDSSAAGGLTLEKLASAGFG